MGRFLDRILAGAVPDGGSKGTARWAGLGEIMARCDSAKKRPDALEFGVSFCKDTKGKSVRVAKADDKHVNVLAASRDGKGRSMLTRWGSKWPGSFFGIDPKGEQALLLARVRAERGQDVTLLDPFGVCAAWYGGEPIGLENSYNVLDEIEASSPIACDDIRALATVLIQEEKNDQWWPAQARNFVMGLLALGIANRDLHGAWRISIPDLLDIVGMPADNPVPERPVKPRAPGAGAMEFEIQDYRRARRECAAELIAWRQAMRDYTQGLMQWVKALMVAYPIEGRLGDMIREGGQAYVDASNSGNTDGCGIIRNTIRKNLGVFGSEPMRMVCRSSELRMGMLKRDPASVFLVLPVDMMQSHSAWLRIVVHSTIMQLAREKSKPKHQVMMMLDEAYNLGELEILKMAVSLMAGEGLKLVLVWQDIGQMKERYPDSWGTFFQNAGTTVILGVEDDATCEYVSKWCGTTMERRVFKKSRWVGRTLFNASVAYPQATAGIVGLLGIGALSVSFMAGALIIGLALALGFIAKLSTGGNPMDSSGVRLAPPARQTVPLLREDELRKLTSSYQGGALVKLRGCNWIRVWRENYDQVLVEGVDYDRHPQFGPPQPGVAAVLKEWWLQRGARPELVGPAAAPALLTYDEPDDDADELAEWQEMIEDIRPIEERAA